MVSRTETREVGSTELLYSDEAEITFYRNQNGELEREEYDYINHLGRPDTWLTEYSYDQVGQLKGVNFGNWHIAGGRLFGSQLRQNYFWNLRGLLNSTTAASVELATGEIRSEFRTDYFYDSEERLQKEELRIVTEDGAIEETSTHYHYDCDE